jgi:hypothetical protein
MGKVGAFFGTRILVGYKKLWPRMIFQESEQGEIVVHTRN